MTYGFQQQQLQPNFSKAFTVTSKEQATNTPVDFNGLPTFFYNQNSNEVYLKQFDIKTGSAIWKEYKAVEPVSNEKKIKYLDVDTYTTDYNALNAKIDGLISKLDERGSKK